MKNISIRIEDSVANKIDAIAKIQDRDRSYIINKAIKNYIKHEEYILDQINRGLKDIEDGNVITEDELKNSINKFINNLN